jgi:AcrR family transcriptional regulator
VTAVTARAAPRRRGTQAPGGFRARLLAGMAAAIAEHGYRQTTVADVVRHAHTSRRTFYQHFGSKQDCFIAVLRESSARMVRQIAAAVDRRAPWEAQVRQAIGAWIDSARSEPAVTLSWIREVPALGDAARQLQREALEEFIVLVQTLTTTPELRAAGIMPPPRQFAVILLGGLRELIATTVEDGGDIADIVPVAVAATMAMLGPRAV